jgi:hypothetical protein
MISIILKDFKNAQTKLIEWDLKQKDELDAVTVYF